MEWEAHRPSAPGTPSSMSSNNSGGSSARTEKTPNFKQLSPSPSVAALSKIPDQELRMKGPDELVRLLRRLEVDYKTLLGEHGNVVKDVNRRLQIFVLETRGLKENVHKLQEDNQELRDLCCFLDDDRQKGRKLAREWQRFGRYTASVMRSEVAVYQEKLKELEERQSELITENMDLKELCLYLDQERLRSTSDRDEGDGSSNGTITGPEDGLASPTAIETSGSLTPTPGTSIGNYPTTPSSTASYIKELESKIQRLEEEKKHLSKHAHGINGDSADDITKGKTSLDGLPDNDGLSHQNNSTTGNVKGYVGGKTVASKPEAVVHAMKVLEVHEELEKSATEEDLDAPEKAIVREMCNVVWRKLGDVGDVGNLNESSDSILDPPFIAQSPSNANQAAVASPTGPASAFSQGQAHSYSIAQPQPQMASTPLAFASSRGTQNVQSTGSLHGNLHHGNVQNVTNPMSTLLTGNRNPLTRLSQEPPYQTGLHNQRQQSHNYLHPPQLQQQPSLSHGLGDFQSSNIPRHHQSASGPKPMHNKYPPKPFAPVQSNHNQSKRPPPLSLSHHESSNSDGPPSAPASATDLQQRPLHSPTKSLSEHLPFSHPNFQHRQQPQFAHPTHQQPPSSMPSVSAPPRQGDHRAQFPQGPPPQHSAGSQDQTRSLASTSSAPNRPPYQNQQQQPYHRQHDNPIGSSHPPSTVRLLGAPGNRGRSVEAGDRSKPESQAGGYQRTAPGGPPQPKQSGAYRNVGPNVRPGMNSGSSHNQPMPRGSDDALLYDKRGMLSNRDPPPANPSSSDSNPYGPLGYSQDGLKTSGFRAYPSQSSVLPSQPAPSWGGPRPTNMTDRAGLNPGQPPPPNSHRGSSAALRPNLPVPTNQIKGPQGNRFQEQEWRQTYLDDSDTL